MLDHIHAMDSKLEMLCEALERAHIEIKDMPLPELKSNKFNGSETIVEPEQAGFSTKEENSS